MSERVAIMVNTSMAICSLTLLLIDSSGVSAKAAPQTRDVLDRRDVRLTIAICALSDINKSLVDRIFNEAKAIWAPAGISLDWHRVGPQEVVRTSQIDVTIDDVPDAVETDRAALGSIFFIGDDPEPSIHLSRANAEASILRADDVGNTSAFAHEILLGRALGRALSHELGHYLLKSKEHTRRGLMRASWTSEEFLAAGRNGFELTPLQREIAAHFDQGRRSKGGF